jgi:small subunit ribosomal protein S20
MAITQSAKKAQRVSVRKGVFNIRTKRIMKSALKEVKDSTKTESKEKTNLLKNAYKAIDKAVKRGVIKKNTAKRKKSSVARNLENKK